MVHDTCMINLDLVNASMQLASELELPAGGFFILRGRMQAAKPART